MAGHGREALMSPRGRLLYGCAGILLIMAPCRREAWCAPAGAALALSRDALSAPFGPASAAVADSAASMNVNPAGLGFIQRPELSAFYSSYLLDTHLSALSLAYPGTKVGPLGVGYFGFRSGGFKGRDSQGHQTGDFSAEDRVMSLAVARPVRLASLFSPGSEALTSIGLTGKFFESRLASAEARTYAVDVGGLHRFDSLPLSLGLAVTNIGPGLRYRSQVEPLPLGLGAALALGLKTFPARLVAGAAHGLSERKTDISLGLETVVGGLLSLKGAYILTAADKGRSAGVAPSLVGGFGLRLSGYQLDGSVTPMGELGLASQVSLTMRFGRAVAPQGRQSPDYFYGGSRELKNTEIQRKAPRPREPDEDLFRSGGFMLR